jgi:exodeoxyribonuclease VII large subunit
MSPRADILPIEAGPAEPRIWTVSDLAKAVKGALELEFGTVVVQGEISGYKAHGSGHHYFELKDPGAMIQVALFRGYAARLRGPLANGMAVQVEGELTAYAQRSQYQIVAHRVTPVGYGALQAQFEALRRKLETEGLFAPERKRPLPRYPTRIGIVTSPTGAAIRDMLRILRSRAPYARITLVPVRVQGEGAAEEIAEGIRLLGAWGRVDVILLGRGGGSPQDLWAFNEEPVVRAVAASPIPTISAVGHESDTTLADYAADLRAATPTHGAQQVVPDRGEVEATLRRLTEHARRKLLADLAGAQARLRGIRTHHALRAPEQRARELMQRVDELDARLLRGLGDWVVRRRRRAELLDERLRGFTPRRAMERARDRLTELRRRGEKGIATDLARLRDRVAAFGRQLELVDYRSVLGRGYALVWAEGRARLVNRGRELRPDQAIELEFADARARARVREILPGAEEESR